MEFSVCIDSVFRGLPVAERLRAVQAAGIGAYEFWSWWDKDLGEMKALNEELGLKPVACCTKFVSLVDPSARDAYVRGLTESIEAAKALGAPALISQTGDDTGGDREAQRRSLTDGLKACAPLLEKAGITLLVEPLNLKVDHAGYYLSSSAEGFAIVDEVGSPNVKLLYDIYHQQITEGDLIRTITGNIERIGHFHAAGHPGRHELYRGEIHYPAVFEAIRETGYQGYVGLEYFPKDDPLQGLLDSIAL